MHRSVLIAMSAAAVAVSGVPVHAGPAPADVGRVAAAQVTFALGRGRTLSLELRAAALSGGNTLRVLAQRCYPDGSCAHARYQSPIAPAALTVDPKSAVADLRTILGGHVLHVRWRPDGTTGVVIGGTEAAGGGMAVSGSTYSGDPAAVLVELDNRRCTGDGAVGEGALAGTGPATGTPADAALSELRVPAKATISCR